MSVDTNNLDIFLGKRMRAFRAKMHWPLKVVASELGVSIQQVQRYEQGVNKISASMLFELSKLFSISIDCFFEGFDPDHTAQPEKKVGFNVLLVEDNLHDEFLIRKALDDFPKKLNIYTIHDGQQALSYFRNINEGEVTQIPKPDLIVLDLYLPGMKGFELLKDLKKGQLFATFL